MARWDPVPTSRRGARGRRNFYAVSGLPRGKLVDEETFVMNETKKNIVSEREEQLQHWSRRFHNAFTWGVGAYRRITTVPISYADQQRCQERRVAGSLPSNRAADGVERIICTAA
jgi:hypothetical protein